MTNQGPESHCDLLVVGAGPAGTSAAITAARAGLRVTVIDKAKFPRDKCCGDGLTTLALRQLHALGFDPATVPSWQDVDAAYLRSPSGREVRLPLPKHGRFAAVTPRLELDAALVDHARAMGATIVEECAFVEISTNADSVDVAVDTKGSPSTIRATWVVAADGMWSPVRKALGVSTPGYLGEWHAFRQYANNVTGPAKDRLIVWFDEDLLPGYAWSFPLPGNRVNIGFGILRDGERRVQDMKDLWTDLLRRDHVVAALGDGFQLEDRHTAWPIPARIDEAVTAIGRILFVGDAAMATDALTGEGIGQALLTGVEAAKAVIAGGDAATVRGRYARAVNHHLLADHRMSVRLSKVLSKSRGARGAIALLARSGSWGRRNFARWMFEDEPRAIALTPRRWHRRLFRQHGAY
ncbi:MAG: NAD(P)/FAD-dependent oxidoreductase [Ilumatobacteraceae bacterium]